MISMTFKTSAKGITIKSDVIAELLIAEKMLGELQPIWKEEIRCR